MDTFEFVTVPIIISVVYAVIALLKKETHGSEKVLKRLPLIAAILGAVLGAIAFFAIPDMIPANNAFAAILIGAASGLAATGTNQIFKQMTKKDEEDKSDGGTDTDGENKS